MDANEKRRCCRVIVHGRVQGVWFRESTKAEARRIGVAGWVRNLPNGTVEALFEGSREAVQAAIRYCERGPTGALVNRIEQFDEAPQGLTGFSARYG